MTTFKQLQENTDIRELIHATFDVDLPLSGGWGYTKASPMVIEALPEGMTLVQLEHMLASIRAHLEMNITQEKTDRFAGINANETAREQSKDTKDLVDRVIYKITAIQETLYNTFIKEYKEGYGKEEFDLAAHFKKREESTLTRNTTHYFQISKLT